MSSAKETVLKSYTSAYAVRYRKLNAHDMTPDHWIIYAGGGVIYEVILGQGDTEQSAWFDAKRVVEIAAAATRQRSIGS